jgi:hydroxymethylglutaryl-CoA lyase
MANHDQLFKMINKKDNVSYPVLIPNEKGLEKALEVGVKEIAVYFNLVGFCGSFGIF